MDERPTVRIAWNDTADGVSIWERSQQSALGLPRHGAVYLAIRYGDRLVDAGINPSMGSVGDSHDN